MGIYTEEIKKFSVKVTYDRDDSCGAGSGVLVKINDSICYVITAKHNFKVGANKTYKDVDVKNLKLNLDKIKINKDIEKNLCTIDKIIYEDDRYDILIFTTSNWTNYIEGLDKVNIDLTQSHTYEYYCFYGYPIDKEGTPSKKMEHHGYREAEEYILRLDRVQSSNDDAVTGFSGSGIFGKNKKDSNFYLMGIFTEFEDDHEFYYGIDFNRIFNEVDKKLIIPLKNYKQSYIFDKGDYLEPRTVLIKKLNIHVAVCPITYEEFNKFVKDTGHRKPREYKGKSKNRPVVDVDWDNAISYCIWLSKKTGIKYQLPTLIEWNQILNENMNNLDAEELKKYVCYNTDKTIQVNKKKPSQLGIYHILGNVNEWCYTSERLKSAKGGSYNNKTINELVNMDIKRLPSIPSPYIGFRVVRKND